MSDVKHLEDRLNSVMGEITGIIDEMIEVRKNSPQNKEKTAKILEEFLSNLYHYFKTASKESGDNLLAGVSLVKIKLMN
ncbi:MAG: hypothetical protein GXY91_04840 [Clostridia bacterium]|nr:hypothetical protein [Clostridia bacterium]